MTLPLRRGLVGDGGVALLSWPPGKPCDCDDRKQGLEATEPRLEGGERRAGRVVAFPGIYDCSRRDRSS